MKKVERGRMFTALALLLALVAIEDLLKPLKLEGPQTGIVFFGTRQSGLANAVLGPLLGIVLLVYAMGVWTMKRYVIGIAWSYAAYVILNLALFTMKNPSPGAGEMIFATVYALGAISITLGAAVALTRRRTTLS